MRIVLQRVSHASVEVQGEIVGAIERGYLLLLGIEEQDGAEDILYLCRKIAQLRIFNDESGKMNLNLEQVGGRILLISQFTLFGDSQKGNRPSFVRAARPAQAIPLYEAFQKELENQTKTKLATGIFGADMKVALCNDGPVTLVLDSKQRSF